MFLTPKQEGRRKRYNELSPQERATFNFRMGEKVNTFLDDVSEVNRVLDLIPFNYHQKAIEEDHLDYVFDLLEKMLAALDFAPIIPNKEGNPYKVKGFFMAPKGGGEMGKYQITIPATKDDIRLKEYLKLRLERLSLFIEPTVTADEFRPREYFGDLPDLAEKEGYEPIFYDPFDAARAKLEEGRIQRIDEKRKPKGSPRPRRSGALHRPDLTK